MAFGSWILDLKINLLPPGADREGDLRRRFPVKETVLEVGTNTLRLLHPSDIDGLIHRAKEENELPFWAYLWPASVALARYIMEGTPETSEASLLPAACCAPPAALELGCGVGLAGIAGALRGWEVVQTDLVPDALRFARANALRNGVSIPVFVGDWRRMALRRRFDLILGSDILYEPKLHPALSGVLRDCLAPGGRVLISDPCRVYALQFMAKLEDNGWSVCAFDVPPLPDDDTSVLIYSAAPP